MTILLALLESVALSLDVDDSGVMEYSVKDNKTGSFRIGKWNFIANNVKMW